MLLHHANVAPTPGPKATHHPPLRLAHHPMTDGPLTADARHALRALTRLVADRAAREARLKRDLEESLAAATAKRSFSASAREARVAAERERLAAEFAQAQALARERCEAASTAAIREAEQRLSTIEDRAETDAASLRKRLEEAAWMAETLYDSESPRPVQAFDRVRATVSGCLTQLAAIEQQTAALLAQWRMGQPPAADASTSSNIAAPPPETADVGAAELRLATDAAVRACDRAASGVLPRLFIVALPEALAILGGAGLGVLAAWQSGWNPIVGLGSGAGAAVFLGAGLFALHRTAKASLLHRVATAAQTLSACRARAKDVLAVAATERDRASAAIKANRDSTIASAKAALTVGNDELRTLRQRHRTEAEQAKAAALESATRQRDDALAAAETANTTGLSNLDEWASSQTAADDATFTRTTEQANALFTREWAALEHDWHGGTHAASQTLERITQEARAAFTPWPDAVWANLNEAGEGDWPRNNTCPSAIPIGVQRACLPAMPGGLSADSRLALRIPGEVPLPVALELPDRCSLLVQFGTSRQDPTTAAARTAALDTLRNTALRLLTGLPPGKVRFTFIDPVGLGQSFSAFMHLADHNEQLVGERIWTEPRHIEARLADLTEHMENVIQKYLRNQFATIEDYNVHAGEVAEPYRFLVLADLPSGLNEAAAKRLASIIAAGPRCGVYTLIAQDLRHPLPAGLLQADLDQAHVRLVWKKIAGSPPDAPPAFVRIDTDFAQWPLRLEAPPADARFNAIVHAAGRAAAHAGRVEVPFEMVAPGAGQVWSASTARELSIPVGRAGATKLQHLILGRGTAQHALIAGRTGSGKSTLLHALIVSGALWHSPAELEYYLVDFKKGVEFKTYATHRLPHARVVAVESEREFGLSVLRRLDGELRSRGDLFRAAGAQDVAGFRASKPTHPMPRTVLVIDEFQELFVEDDKIAQESALLLDRLVRQGRAFGMHVVLGSQTLGGAYSLARSTIGQMGVRIALACNEADALLIMGDDNTAPRLLNRPGEAIYNDSSGAVEANNPFQVAWLSDARRAEVLDDAARRAAGDGLASAEPIVFEGGSAADLSRNRPLRAARAAAAARGSATQSPLLWLGEPVAIKDPTAFTLRRQSGSNLLILGQRDQTALAFAVSALASLGAQGTRGDDVLVLDGTPADAAPDTVDVLERAAAAHTPGARLIPYREIAPTLAALAAEIDRRASEGASSGPTKVLLIHGLQRFRTLRRPENEFDFSPSTGEAAAPAPDKLLVAILRDGPGVGIHVVCWCDTLANLNRTLDRSSIHEFDGRVLMQVSAADSSALIDSPAAGLIGANRAILFSEEQGTIEKFVPYALA